MSRCVVSLVPPGERWSNHMMRQRAYEQAQISAMQELVMESVHPGNFPVLPPSPGDLSSKARMIGIHWEQ